MKQKLHDIINQAVEECIQEDILKDFLLENKSEVIDSLLAEFNQEIYEKGILEDGIQLGLQQGLQRGRTSINMLNSLLLNANRMDDLKRAIVDEEYQAQLMKELLPQEANL